MEPAKPVRRAILDVRNDAFSGRRLTTPPHRPPLVGVPEVMSRLGLNHALASHLMISQWAAHYAATEPDLPWCWVVGGSLFIPEAALDLLAAVPVADCEALTYLNVRVGPGTHETNPLLARRRYAGVSPWFSTEDIQKSVLGLWAVNDGEAWVGELFVASLAGYVVRCGRITRARQVSGLFLFEIDADDEQACRSLQGRRIPVHAGASVVKRRPAPSSAPA